WISWISLWCWESQGSELRELISFGQMRAPGVSGGRSGACTTSRGGAASGAEPPVPGAEASTSLPPLPAIPPVPGPPPVAPPVAGGPPPLPPEGAPASGSGWERPAGLPAHPRASRSTDSRRAGHIIDDTRDRKSVV